MLALSMWGIMAVPAISFSVPRLCLFTDAAAAMLIAPPPIALSTADEGAKGLGTGTATDTAAGAAAGGRASIGCWNAAAVEAGCIRDVAAALRAAVTGLPLPPPPPPPPLLKRPDVGGVGGTGCSEMAPRASVEGPLPASLDLPRSMASPEGAAAAPVGLTSPEQVEARALKSPPLIAALASRLPRCVVSGEPRKLSLDSERAMLR